MSINTLAEYRNLYRNRHGIECPLSDAQVRTAMATAGVGEDVWPLSLAVLTEMEALVTTNFPSVDQVSYQHASTLQAPTNLVADNATTTQADLNFSLPTGGNPPYSIQLQQAPDAAGVAGTFVNKGAAQATAAEIVTAGLTLSTKYWWQLVVTDHLGEVKTSNQATLTTAAV